MERLVKRSEGDETEQEIRLDRTKIGLSEGNRLREAWEWWKKS